MSKREDAEFQAWMAERIAEFPEDKREAAQAVLETDVAREEFFRGTLRSREFYRKLNEVDEMRKELESTRDELYAWYEEETPKQEALIAERDLLKKQLAEREGNPPPAPGIPGFSTEDLAALKAKAEKIEALDKIIPAVMADMGAIAKDAWKNGFDYDPHEVMRVSLQQGVAPYKAYEHLTSDQRRKRYDEAQEAERKKWIEEGRRQAITAKNGSPDNFPNAGPVWEALNDIERKESTRNDRVAASLGMLLEQQGD